MKSGSLANSFSFDLVFSGGSIIISSTLSDRSAASIFFTALSRALFQLVDLALDRLLAFLGGHPQSRLRGGDVVVDLFDRLDVGDLLRPAVDRGLDLLLILLDVECGHVQLRIGVPVSCYPAPNLVTASVVDGYRPLAFSAAIQASICDSSTCSGRAPSSIT